MGFVQSGKEWVVDKIQTPGAMAIQDYVAWGTGSVAENNATDTALGTPAAEARTQGTVSQPTTTTDRLVGTITCAGAGKTISEVGRFNASTAGIMQQRHVFTGIPLLVGDQIQFTLDLVVS